MRLKRGFMISMLLLVLLVVLAGCFQQAGESFTPVGSESEPIALPQSSPTPLENNPDGSITGQESIPTSDNSSSSPVAPPTSGVAITVISPTRPGLLVTETPVNQSGGELPTATEGQFLTPFSPLGPVTPETSVPLLPGQSATATPSGLITPTALPGADNATDCTHTVQPGENLFRIAVNNDITVAQLRQANPQVTGDVIHPGDVLKIPDCNASGSTGSAITIPTSVSAPPGGAEVYVVQRGDTLTTIAQHFGVTVKALQDANNLSDPNRLSVGQQLVIPPKSG